MARHKKEKHDIFKKSCSYCKREFGFSNLSRLIRSVHDNEIQNFPDCRKLYSISNLRHHIKSVHQRLNKTCDICYENVSVSYISLHRRKVQNIGKPIHDVTPTGPQLQADGKVQNYSENQFFSNHPDLSFRIYERKQPPTTMEHKCNTCEKVFTEPSLLKRHIRCHSSKVPT